MPPTVYVGEGAIERLLGFCERRLIARATLVADPTTYHVLGRRVADAWVSRGWDLRVAILNGSSVVADEHHIMRVLLGAEPDDGAYLAVGAGTITDIVRFVSFVTRREFISLPTAPSVDGYTSGTAALTIGKSKHTVPARPPIAVFADLDTLAAAPKPMIAAGFGDMVGKFTSLADWQLGHLLWGEAYSEAIASRVRAALARCMAAAAASPPSRQDIRRLMEGLVESGQCIADFGTSEAASGSEHHLSHYWEMLLLWQNRPPLLHGVKVAVGTILVARIYEAVRRLTRSDVAQRLSVAMWPDRDAEVRAIRSGYDYGAESVVAAHAPFLNLTQSAFESLKARIIDRWETVRAIASTVPPAEQLLAALKRLDAPVTPTDLGLSEHDVVRALRYAPYLRNRFTVLKLARLLALDVEGVVRP